MMNSTSGSKRRKKEKELKVRGGLALGYEVLEIRDEGDEGMLNCLSLSLYQGWRRGRSRVVEREREEIEEEDGLMIESAPPLSIYYPPSSHSSFTKLVPTALPPKSLSVRIAVVGCTDDRILLL
jgi:hypothetical protein